MKTIAFVFDTSTVTKDYLDTIKEGVYAFVRTINATHSAHDHNLLYVTIDPAGYNLFYKLFLILHCPVDSLKPE